MPSLLPMPIALEAALVRSEAVSLTVLTTRLITLRALDSAPPFFELLRFFEEAFLAGAFFAAFFAGAFFFEAFFAAFFFAGAFFEEAFFDDALRLAAFFDDAFLLDFLALAFFFDDFLADFFEADFFADFLDFLAAMESLLFKTWSVGSRTFERKIVCCVATALHEFQCRRRCHDCHARNGFRDGVR